ncbi:MULTISPECIES: mannonate dehydratase [Pannonibacter]|uniref:Mannonate dehydratase n=1 Tax=Pannonibacter phragmitetus TaxID=121719 RepID=A0A0U3PJW5_9HYPH|nr:mannonate dehydratase [Pannonibacter phragmitetus]ALV27836.1 mannonate dehydratase [Pannonibacter phragmitetus]
MEQTWRWFGPADPVSLADIRQAGATGIVSALHDQPNGTVWPVERILERKAVIEAAGLTWSVVESIPVHEDIKTAAPGWERYAEAWVESMVNLARCGVRIICYNFMPVIDWTRTDLAYELPDGARCLRFDADAFAAFDLFILKREGAEAEYSAQEIDQARATHAAMSEADVAKLMANIIAGLPGAEESYSLDSFRARLATYAEVDAERLRANLAAFLKIVIPVAEKEGVVLAIHPDDPPRPLFGLPRVVSTAADMKAIAAMVDSPANGFTFCTGSYGVRPDNNLVEMFETHADRVHFLHLRATKREADPRSFHEAAHLDGDVDMVAVIKAVLLAERRRGIELPMRPDHGHQLLDDLRKTSNPGYPAIGRLRGLAELRGVERAIRAFI